MGDDPLVAFLGVVGFLAEFRDFAEHQLGTPHLFRGWLDQRGGSLELPRGLGHDVVLEIRFAQRKIQIAQVGGRGCGQPRESLEQPRDGVVGLARVEHDASLVRDRPHLKITREFWLGQKIVE